MHKMNWVVGPHNSLSKGTILRFKYVYGNRLTEEKKQQNLNLQKPYTSDEISSAKTAGGWQMSGKVSCIILILTFLWAYISNPCPQTACRPRNSYPYPIWLLFFCYASPTHYFYVAL